MMLSEGESDPERAIERLWPEFINCLCRFLYYAWRGNPSHVPDDYLWFLLNKGEAIRLRCASEARCRWAT